MSDLIRDLVSQIITALAFGHKKEDMILFLNEADLHLVAAQEPNFFKAEKTPTGESRSFMGVSIRLLGNKGSPLLVKRIM